ncbi:glycine cleavage system aminomethyltransferase GcvT [Pontimonas sp.]|nr:glycine cleavage system aminomethyltransferase GcvT [Pontimonas sp.]
MSKQTPLYAAHQRAGASFTDFAGYDMPVRYESDLVEHHAVREAAGMFDLSHMAEISVVGSGAPEFLDYALSNRLSALENHQAKYSLLLSPEGGVIDDLIVYRLAEDRYLIVANAANRDAAVSALAARTDGFDVTVSDDSDEWALIAVQGPHSKTIISEAGIDLPEDFADLRYYRITTGTFNREQVLIARTGYTGEDGYEVYVSDAHAQALWDELEATGANHGMRLCGLACRDTLRLEAGMPLYGHELSLEWTPGQAGLGKVVVAKESFVGMPALDPAPSEARVLVGLVGEGKRAARAGYAVRSLEGDTIGEVTSGALSPTLGYPIAMAYVDPQHAQPDTELVVDVRGSDVGVRVQPLPFYQRKKAGS